jgi:TRAP-type C4-dicarboxylate transport system permease small subunit
MRSDGAFDRFVKLWAKRFSYVGYAACLSMLCLSVIDIVGSKLFSRPLNGAFDIISLVAVLVAAFPIASTELAGGHVRLDLGLVFLPKSLQKFCRLLANLLSLGLVVLLVYASIRFGIKMLITHEATMTLAVPLYPFVFALVLGCLPLLLVFLLELKEPGALDAEKEGDRL